MRLTKCFAKIKGEIKMPLRQTNEEYVRNVEALEKSLLPAVLVNSEANGNLLSGWMLGNCTDRDGVIDASLENLRRGVAALHKAGMIEWSVAPKKRPSEIMDSGRENHARKEQRFPDPGGIQSACDAIRKAVATFDSERERRILHTLRTDCETYRGRTHGRSFAGREKLKAKLDELVSKGIRADEVKKQIDALRNQLE
jgi:hypothetical protein